MREHPQQKRYDPAITIEAKNDHPVRSDHFRYIRDADGSEEWYDHHADPRERHNLVGDARCFAIIAEPVKWLPAA